MEELRKKFLKNITEKKILKIGVCTTSMTY